MANGLPWVGSYGKPPSKRDQSAPTPGSYAPPAAVRTDDTKVSNDKHASLAKDFDRGEIMSKDRQ